MILVVKRSGGVSVGWVDGSNNGAMGWDGGIHRESHACLSIYNYLHICSVMAISFPYLFLFPHG